MTNNRILIMLATTLFASVFASMVFATLVWAQETTTDQSVVQTGKTTTVVKEIEDPPTETAAQTNDTTAQAGDAESKDDSSTKAQVEASDQELRFPPGTQTAGAQRARQLGGPLAGTPVETVSTDDNDQFVEVILIRRPDCKAERGASFVLEDEDGTQATFIERDSSQSTSTQNNVRISETRDGLKVTADSTDGNNIVPINEVGSDEDLDTGGLKIVTSTGITCNGEDPNDEDGEGNSPSEDDGDVENANNDDATATDATETGTTETTTDGTTTTDETTTTDDTAKAADEIQDLSCEELLVLFRAGVSSGQYVDVSSLADADVQARIEVCLEQEIVQGTAAGQDLPDTGGVSLLGLAVLGIVSAAAGLSVIRAGRRER